MKRRKFLSALGTLTLAAALAFGGAPSYFPPAIGDFGGAADYLQVTTGLTGNANGKLGIFSVWLKVDGGTDTNRYIYSNTSFRFIINLVNVGGSENELWIRGLDSVSVEILNLQTSAIAVGSGWRHVVSSWDLGNSVSHLYVDDISDNYEDTLTDATIDYTRPTHEIGRQVGASAYWDGALAEVYINTAEYLDLSVETNRRLFIDANGFPVDLGPSGYKPTGTAPIVYMRTQYNNAGLNSGTGGDFTINGAPIYTMGPVPFPLTTWSPGGARGRGGRGGRAFMH